MLQPQHLAKSIRVAYKLFAGKEGPRFTGPLQNRVVIRDDLFYYQLGLELGINHAILIHEIRGIEVKARNTAGVIDAADALLQVHARFRVRSPEDYTWLMQMVKGKTIRQIVRGLGKDSKKVHSAFANAVEYYDGRVDAESITLLIDFAER